MKNFALAAGLMVITASGWAATGSAYLVSTSSASVQNGVVTFTDQAGGVHVQATLVHVSPGKHAFHIHEFGACGDQGKAAGSHYNPENAPHGLVMKDGMTHAHAGDMGNIEANAKGEATLDILVPGISLGDHHPIGGRAVVLHEKADDFSQPAGNAGGRMACGTIIITGK